MNLTTRFFRQILLTALMVIAFSCKPNEEKNLKSQETVVQAEPKKPEKVLRHMVIFKFNEDSSEADIDKLNTAFTKLPEAIPEIVDFEWGLNQSPENFDQDFTHCYLVTFKSEKDRDSIYAPHPAHMAFVESIQPHLEKVFVVDYWTNP
ncbi:Dabb family protein [Flagellimonas sp.]|uniref:Dabb family protein n=1 Tax=Flagellimonas sp. TaxID=2058762 RepID=UPI003F49FF1B